MFTFKKFALIIGCTLCLLIVPTAQPVKATPGVLQTLGDFFSLGANTVREIQETIPLVSEEMQGVLGLLESDINGLLDSIEEKYQDNLNISIDQLDSATQKKLLDLERIFSRVNKTFNEDINLASEAAKDVIRNAQIDANVTISEVERSLEEVVIDFGETTVYILNRATYNTLTIIGGIGLLVFLAIIALLFFGARGTHTNYRVVAYIALLSGLILSGLLLFYPPSRVYAMRYTGTGLRQQIQMAGKEPHIIGIMPDTIIIGETEEVDIWGSSLNLDEVLPTVMIADQVVPVSASSEHRIVINVSDLVIPEGNTNIKLSYENYGDKNEVVRIVEPTPILEPADLLISEFVIVPESPETQRNSKAVITILNQGESRADSFGVLWKPSAADSGIPLTVEKLDPGQTRKLAFDHVFIQPGSFQTLATVDYGNEIVETDETNNTEEKNITVIHPKPTFQDASVVFTRYSIKGNFKGFNTEISTEQYYCGIIGFAANWGDIEENDDGDIIRAEMKDVEKKWHIYTDFRSHKNDEDWTVHTMCVNKDKNHPELVGYQVLDVKGGTSKGTDFDKDDYVCGVVGMYAKEGDIEEDGTGNIISAYAYKESSNDNWQIQADFRTQSGHNEKWTIRVLCLSYDTDLLKYDEKPDLEDNVDEAIGLNAGDYICGIFGISAEDGDIQEEGTGDIIKAFMYTKDETWHIRADFRSHKHHENWSINYLCVDRSIAEYR